MLSRIVHRAAIPGKTQGLTEAIVQQLLKVWSQLDLRRQIIVVLATGAMFFAVIAMSRMATAPSMSLLYAGLESGAAGEWIAIRTARGSGSTALWQVDLTGRNERRLQTPVDGSDPAWGPVLP